MEKIILFGKGKCFRHKINLLKKYDVICIIDNTVPETVEIKYENTNIKMLHPSSIDINGGEKIFLMAINFISMWKQLVELGINPERIVYPFYEKPFFQSDFVLNEMILRIDFKEDRFVVVNKNGVSKDISTLEEWNEYLRKLFKMRYGLISAVSDMEIKPISEQFATERGTPVDRVYIDRFLRKKSYYITGDVLEVEDNTYTKRYGTGKINKSIVMDLDSAANNIDFNANIETGLGIKEEIADCFILTQTLMYVFDLKAAAHNIMRMLKPGGVALITCSGLSQNSKRCMENYGVYFNFNPDVFGKMFEDEEADIIDVGSLGNVKTVVAHLSGLCAEDLSEDDFDIDDNCYPLIVYAVVKKNE